RKTTGSALEDNWIRDWKGPPGRHARLGGCQTGYTRCWNWARGGLRPRALVGPGESCDRLLQRLAASPASTTPDPTPPSAARAAGVTSSASITRAPATAFAMSSWARGA